MQKINEMNYYRNILHLLLLFSRQKPSWNYRVALSVLKRPVVFLFTCKCIGNYNMNFPNAVSLVRRKHTTKIPFSFWMRPLTINSASRFVSHKLYHCNTRPTRQSIARKCMSSLAHHKSSEKKGLLTSAMLARAFRVHLLVLILKK